MSTSERLDLGTWPRRAAFEHFRQLPHPHFNICVEVDLGNLASRVAQCPGATPFLVYHHAALRAANAVAPFRYRLEGSGVRVHQQVDGSTVVLREDQSIGFANLRYEPELPDFVAAALPVLERVRQPGQTMGGESRSDAPPLIHMTTLPWLRFSSFSFARGHEDSDTPKLAFGRMQERDGRLRMPVAVEVHHALMDGLHVAQFFEALEAALA